MRNCQTCGEARAQVLVHEGDEAVCPVCGHREPAPRRPLFVVTGASAVGKSTVRSALAEELAADAAVFDSDTFMDAFARAGGGGGDDIDWDALAEAWVEVAHGLARQGRDMVLLCSFDPPLIERLPNRSSLTAVHYLLLDCADATREARLAARPPWRGPDVAGQRTWSRLLRAAVDNRIRTDLRTPAETVAAIAAWVRTGGHHAGDASVDPPRARLARPRAKAVPRAAAPVPGSDATTKTTTSPAARTAARSAPRKAVTSKAAKKVAPKKASSPRKTAGTKAAAAKKTAAKKTAAREASPTAKKAAAREASPKKAAGKKAVSKKVTAPTRNSRKPVAAPATRERLAPGPPDPA